MKNDDIARFDAAVAYTGRRIKKLLLDLPPDIKGSTQEIRMRCSRPLMINGLYGTFFVQSGGKTGYLKNSQSETVSITDIEECFHCACSFSVHTHLSGICNGFVTVSGGHRIGLTGTAVRTNGEITGVREISSINIRIAKEYKGMAAKLFNAVKNSERKSLIVAGPPSSGKTTILRDLARLMAGEEGGYKKTVIIDEREELAACSNGVPQNDIGISSDVLSGYPKGDAVLIAIRSMSPECVVVDEIGGLKEAEAIEEGLNAGVDFYLGVHAGSREDLIRRPQIQRLIRTGAFGTVALLHGRERPSQLKQLIPAEELMV